DARGVVVERQHGGIMDDRGVPEARAGLVLRGGGRPAGHEDDPADVHQGAPRDLLPPLGEVPELVGGACPPPPPPAAAQTPTGPTALRTKVPLTLPRSSILTPAPMWRSACRRETEACSIRISLSAARPTAIDPAAGRSWTATPSPANTATWSGAWFGEGSRRARLIACILA